MEPIGHKEQSHFLPALQKKNPITLRNWRGIKIHAECRMGELLKDQINHKGGKPSHDVTVTKDFGITRMHSYR